ncbi:MAG: STAS/SEC14 domain-containing protein [Bacteroidales bacterium]|nr:STAS/SEC14 domain-containing protein [Bacteroidales bacterium]MBN2756262.1 STAS/SEC14 domain-containing protein [Bacteroidales bacterium]
MRVFEHSEMSIDYFSENNCILIKRLAKKDTDDETFKELILEWISQIKIYKPEKQLIDYSNYDYYISDEMQIWINENLIKPAYLAGMKKVAFVLSRNYYSQVSIEETMKKKEAALFEIEYFDDFEKAEEWLYK